MALHDLLVHEKAHACQVGLNRDTPAILLYRFQPLSARTMPLMRRIDRGKKDIGVHKPFHSISSNATATSESVILTPLGITTIPFPGRASTVAPLPPRLGLYTVRMASEIS
jgi:hypothetical protein